jgi:hypothetical protein
MLCKSSVLFSNYFRQGLELLVTAPIVLTVFAAAMAGALFAPVLTRGIERSEQRRFLNVVINDILENCPPCLEREKN